VQARRPRRAFTVGVPLVSRATRQVCRHERNEDQHGAAAALLAAYEIRTWRDRPPSRRRSAGFGLADIGQHLRCRHSAVDATLSRLSQFPVEE
jgi:hypothetical protein